MTVRAPSPAFQQAVRSLTAEGLELGKIDRPQDEDSAAASLASNGYVDVHVGRSVEERLTIKQARDVQAIHEGHESLLTGASRKLLEDMREIQRHDQRFVLYHGQSGFGGFGRGDYHAFNQTTVPFAMAFAQIDANRSSGEGTWGYHPTLGIVSADQADGQIDRYVSSSALTRTQVAYIADNYRAQDRIAAQR